MGDELRELQDPATWDDEHDEVLPGSDAPRFVVPVSFGGDDFARVAEDARRHRMTMAAFIRAAVLGRLDQHSEAVSSTASIAEPSSGGRSGR